MWPLGGADDDTALLSESGEVSYAELDAMADQLAARYLRGPGRLVVLRAGSDVPTVASYLACCRTETTVLVVDRRISEGALTRVVEAFEPQYVVGGPGAGGGDGWVRAHDGSSGSRAVALVILTSGSTGRPKGVAVGLPALVENTRAIAERLELGPADRAVSSLPFHYSFGLSVLNSHLSVGGSVALVESGPATRRFWDALTDLEVSHLSGVTTTYELAVRRLAEAWPPSLRQLAHSGASMAPDAQRRLVELARAHGARFFAMYGQTELMTRVSASDLTHSPGKIGSVGRPLSGIEIERRDGELIVRSPSAMLGYAQSREELQASVPRTGPAISYPTGDLCEIDDDGFLWLRGRLSRICKPLGRRINLDEVELFVTEHGGRGAAVVGSDRQIVVCVPKGSASRTVVATAVARAFAVPPVAIRVAEVDAVPVTGGGKVDYVALAALVEDSEDVRTAR